ncbi:hypothetical protein AAFF_G00149520 [Aldrovandia affinis]|uniref:C-type lectin domain-containing protein n=1 Tax=Aldrovandia affinis TaxID=143900 RepID=A0AAD7RP05_9TELE|nr:hypothetical protein AAFF_G00149520 [Aldrovandia affinis]
MDFLKPLLGPVTVMLQSLQECSQLELALRLLVNSFSSGLQHVTSNNMDLALSSQVPSHPGLGSPGALTGHAGMTVPLRGHLQLHDRSHLLRDRACVHEFGKTTLATVKASIPVRWHGDGENDRCLIGEWWTVTWPLDTALSSQRKMCLKYCGKSSTTPSKTITRSCTFDLDGDAALNLYITTLLLQQESDEDLGGDEGGMGNTGVSQGESLGHMDALERALQIIPRLHSTNELVIGLSAAILKTRMCTAQWARPHTAAQEFSTQYCPLRSQKRVCRPCPEGWGQRNSTCYYFSTEKKSWNDSRSACLKQGADLVIIESKEEQDFISKHTGERYVYWIGLSDSETEGTWLWVDGTPLQKDKVFWVTRQPDDDHRSEDCAATVWSVQLGDGWFDFRCHAHRWSVCETDALPL